LLRPNIYVSVFLHMKWVLESNMRCVLFRHREQETQILVVGTFGVPQIRKFPGAARAFPTPLAAEESPWESDSFSTSQISLVYVILNFVTLFNSASPPSHPLKRLLLWVRRIQSKLSQPICTSSVKYVYLHCDGLFLEYCGVLMPVSSHQRSTFLSHSSTTNSMQSEQVKVTLLLWHGEALHHQTRKYIWRNV